MKQFPFGIVSMLRVLKHRRPISSNFPVDIAFRCREARKKDTSASARLPWPSSPPEGRGIINKVRIRPVVKPVPRRPRVEHERRSARNFWKDSFPPLFRKESAYRKKIIHTLWLSYKFSHYSSAITKESKNRFIDPLSRA